MKCVFFCHLCFKITCGSLLSVIKSELFGPAAWTLEQNQPGLILSSSFKFYRPHFFITSPDGLAILRKYICHLLEVPFCLFNIHSWCHLFYLKCLPIPTIPLPYLLLPDFSTQQYLILMYSHLMESDDSQFSRLPFVATFIWIIYISEKWTSYYLVCLLFVFVKLKGSLEDLKYKMLIKFLSLFHVYVWAPKNQAVSLSSVFCILKPLLPRAVDQ